MQQGCNGNDVEICSARTKFTEDYVNSGEVRCNHTVTYITKMLWIRPSLGIQLSAVCWSISGGVTLKKGNIWDKVPKGGGLTQTQIFVQIFFFRNHKLSFPIPQNMCNSKNMAWFDAYKPNIKANTCCCSSSWRWVGVLLGGKKKNHSMILGWSRDKKKSTSDCPKVGEGEGSQDWDTIPILSVFF